MDLLGSTTTVRFLRPSFPSSDRIESYFQFSRNRGWYSNGGPCLEMMAARLEERVGCFAIPVSSGTTALMVAAHVLARRTNRTEVLVPSFTFAATVQALIWNGLSPRFVDIDPAHWHMSASALQTALEERADTVGLVVAVSSLGTPPPSYVRQAWEKACEMAGVPLLVDSAAAFGAVADDGVPIGRQGDAEIVSFHITKPFGIGEGGAIFCSDASLASEVKQLINFGFDGSRQPQTPWGLNAKLDELHAAVGLAVLDTFDDDLASRRSRAAALVDSLGGCFQLQEGHGRSTRQTVPILAPDASSRSRILAAAEGRAELRTYYEPLHMSTAFAGVARSSSLAFTDDVSGRTISLPMSIDFADWEVEAVSRLLLSAL